MWLGDRDGASLLEAVSKEFTKLINQTLDEVQMLHRKGFQFAL